MWIRAPWGCQWNGEQFLAQPIELHWADASALFGRGITVRGNPDSGMLSRDHQKQTAHSNGFTRGSCNVQFAGFNDWRLPTADELREIGLNGETPPDSDWDAAHWYLAIFPMAQYENASASSIRRFWSANACREKSLFSKAVAWCCDPSRGGTLWDIPDKCTEHVVFVRKP
jgi:hypothetical protein